MIIYSEERNKKTKEKGITLIALVVTIIVLLILAGVSIAMLTGQNGILKKAQEAKEKTENAMIEEEKQIAMAEASMHNETWTYKTSDDKIIPIPAGFAPTGIDGEDTIKEGVVIIDSIGNEFVWIPCTSKEYENANWKNNWRNWQYKENENIEWSDPQTETGLKSLKKLEEENKDLNSEGIGFYIARYEAGIPNNVDFYANSDGDTYYEADKKDTSNYSPVSKKGVQAWNFASKLKANDMSKKMYADNSSVNSYLIDSHAWNYICDTIITNYTEKSATGDWSSYGNYTDSPKDIYKNLNVLYAYHKKNINGCDCWESKDFTYHKGKILDDALSGDSNNYGLELSTGASEKFKSYNIYDMAGNMCEITTEIGTNEEYNDSMTKMVVRGGSFTESRNR